jgi:type III secretion protein L
MKYFTLIKGDSLHPAPGKKVVSGSQFSKLIEAKEIIEKVKEEETIFRQEVAAECEKLKENATHEGFEAGLQQWTARLKDMEKHIDQIKTEIEASIVPLIMASIKKIIGREIELKRQTIADIISTSLKTVSHHKRITLYVNKNDLDLLEEQKGQLKSLFENLQSFNITTRDDVPVGGCIVETESGIINVGWEQQLKALEAAFETSLMKKEP